ncbi:hypothetical protein [Pseudanabaena sp. UWO310]|uniref:hypothetical protein n=1 Tax=Pseudanabaena sp. UWO310 TaxID=2480795 RepID=UPI001159255C|nr:hypothetical protein [Pseudanabaena sp. UWO310]TYQ29966.1 hypothetical protein PseudUWO310_11135 [Pseudanabaena sp. UWO310]
MGIGFESGISQSVGSSVGGLQGGARFLTPPSGIPIPPEPLPPVPAGIAAGALSLLAPVAAFFGAFFLFPGAAGDPNESKAVQNFNTGVKTVQTELPNTLPFTGGQLPVQYRFHVRYGSRLAYDDFRRYIQGPIGAPHFGYNDGIADNWVISTGQGNITYRGGDLPQIYGVEREDGLSDTNPTVSTLQPSGYTGTNGLTPEEKAKKILPAKIASTLGASGVKSFGAVGGGSPSLSGGRSYTPSDLLPPATPQSPPLTSPPQSPVQTPPSTPPLQKPTPPLEKPKAPLDPLKPYEPNPSDVTGQLASIGLMLGAVNIKVTDIKNNTTPENQQANAKTGACNALNSPSCTKQMEDNIKNPLNQNIDAARNTLAANQFGQDLAFKGLFDNFAKLFSFLDNQYVDRAMGVVNTALNIHNALMLSADLGRTAAGLVDAAIQFTPFRFVASNGSATTASRVFSQNIEAFFINIIGVENYTNLSNTWAVSNRIIRSSTNLLNRVENVVNKNGKVSQQTGIQVGNLANAMLVNGLISKNSYPKVAATKAANDPIDSETADELTSTVGSVQSSIKNLTNVTKEVLTVARNVQKINTEFGKLAQLANADSTVRKNLYTQISTKTRKRSIYTIVDVQQLKIDARKRPNSNPFR